MTSISLEWLNATLGPVIERSETALKNYTSSLGANPSPSDMARLTQETQMFTTLILAKTNIASSIIDAMKEMIRKI